MGILYSAPETRNKTEGNDDDDVIERCIYSFKEICDNIYKSYAIPLESICMYLPPYERLIKHPDSFILASQQYDNGCLPSSY